MIVQSYVKNMGEISEVIIVNESGQEIGKVVVENSVGSTWKPSGMIEYPKWKMVGQAINSEESPNNSFGCSFAKEFGA